MEKIYTTVILKKSGHFTPYTLYDKVLNLKLFRTSRVRSGKSYDGVTLTQTPSKYFFGISSVQEL